MQTRTKSPKLTKQERGCIARNKLIEAGLKIYSEVGFQGASTRKLSATAGVNIAAIPYYFGNKEGLYLAVIDYIIAYYQKHLGSGLCRIKKALQNKHTTREQWYALLDDYIHLLVNVVLRESDECSWMSKIYTREQLDPTSAFQRLYEGFIKDMRQTLEALVGTLLGREVASSEVKLVAETVLGQVAIFKSSRETVLHNMGWKNYGDERMADIKRIVTLNVKALIQAHQMKDITL